MTVRRPASTGNLVVINPKHSLTTVFSNLSKTTLHCTEWLELHLDRAELNECVCNQV